MQIRFWAIQDTDGEHIATYSSADSDCAWIRFNDADNAIGTTMIALATDAETIITEYMITHNGIEVVQAFGIAPLCERFGS